MTITGGQILDGYGALADKQIDLAEVALFLAGLEQPDLPLERYRHHLRKIAQDVAQRYEALCMDGESLEMQAEALRSVLADAHGYCGDSETYDDLQNASLIRVIDRRKGLPITLSILYLHAAWAQGWEAQGLNFPGHFVIRLERDGERLILDPFNRLSALQAADLRRLLKQAMGPQAELSSTYYEPATRREILLRLQNNIKTRLIAGEDYERALRVVEAMRKIDPQEYRLLLDAGLLYARTGRLVEAIGVLEAYIDRAPLAADRHDAQMLLQQIRQSMS